MTKQIATEETPKTVDQYKRGRSLDKWGCFALWCLVGCGGSAPSAADKIAAPAFDMAVAADMIKTVDPVADLATNVAVGDMANTASGDLSTGQVDMLTLSQPFDCNINTLNQVCSGTGFSATVCTVSPSASVFQPTCQACGGFQQPCCDPNAGGAANDPLNCGTMNGAQLHCRSQSIAALSENPTEYNSIKVNYCTGN